MFIGKLVAVFSHPNHELALFGLLRRLKPHVIFLTDGGGQARVEETRKGLSSLGILEQATFLNNTEQSFYDGLLKRDSKFFANVAAQLKSILSTLKPDSLYCDAIEFYNPVHDMALPIVLCARDGDRDNLYEVPLIFQKPGEGESYGVQNVPHGDAFISVGLSEEETLAKKNALSSIYTILRDSMGPLLLSDPFVLKREVVFPSLDVLRPAGNRFLRYHSRGNLLKRSGSISEVITYENHFKPVVMDLRFNQ